MRRAAFLLLVLLASSSLLAQHVDIPVTNWTVPPYNHASGGITTMTDFTPPRVFVAVVPCRVVDTRNAPGPYGGPALATNAVRTFDIDNGPCPGIPAGVDAYSLNFGGILPPADGFLTAWATGTVQPVVSQLNLVGGEVVANAAIVPAGTNGAIDVLVNIGPTHVYIDINGYFSDTLGNPASTLSLTTNSLSAVAAFKNVSVDCVGACGVYAEISSPGVAVGGFASSETGAAVGVAGAADGLSANSAGVVGLGPTLPFNPSSYAPAGVRGESGVIGVLGISGANGVIGDLIQGGAIVARGILGFEVEGIYYGVYSAIGSSAATGALYTVDPHPTDATKVIRYIALEGNEPGTYFRGRGKVERGMARIRVPEDFRMVTDEEGLSVQITPIGEMATVSVVRFDLDEIVVRGSRNVEFFYLVQGVRRTQRHIRSPIGEGEEYRPESAQARMPKGFTEEQKRLLVQNGTYSADGTVNMETARRLGWDRVWADRERASPQPAP